MGFATLKRAEPESPIRGGGGDSGLQSVISVLHIGCGRMWVCRALAGLSCSHKSHNTSRYTTCKLRVACLMFHSEPASSMQETGTLEYVRFQELIHQNKQHTTPSVAHMLRGASRRQLQFEVWL